jgi:two-component system chemotaxis response regulator CheY
MVRALIVDDSEYMRKMLKKILTSAGCEVVGEAEEGTQSIEMYKKLRPDLVTMDIVMRGMNGIDAVRGIMKEDLNATILMVTAMGQEELMNEAKKAGAKGYIIKPFRSAQVIQEIKRVLSK